MSNGGSNAISLDNETDIICINKPLNSYAQEDFCSDLLILLLKQVWWLEAPSHIASASQDPALSLNGTIPELNIQTFLKSWKAEIKKQEMTCCNILNTNEQNGQSSKAMTESGQKAFHSAETMLFSCHDTETPAFDNVTMPKLLSDKVIKKIGSKNSLNQQQ